MAIRLVFSIWFVGSGFLPTLLAQDASFPALDNVPTPVAKSVREYFEHHQTAAGEFQDTHQRILKVLILELEERVNKFKTDGDAKSAQQLMVLIADAKVSHAAGVAPDIPQPDRVPPLLTTPVRDYLLELEKARTDYRKSMLKDNLSVSRDLEANLRRAQAAKNEKESAVLSQLSEAMEDFHKRDSLAMDWLTLFRGPNGEFWNTDKPNLPGRGFARRLTDDNSRITHLRITNKSNRESVILKVDTTIGDVPRETAVGTEWIWNGRADFWGELKNGTVDRMAAHCWRLGIGNRNWPHGYKDSASVAGEKYGFGGFGFARRNLVNNSNSVTMWADKVQNGTPTLEVDATSMKIVTPADGILLNYQSFGD